MAKGSDPIRARFEVVGPRVGKGLALLLLGLVDDLPGIGYLDQSRETEGATNHVLNQTLDKVGDNQGRAEPGTGEINYANVFRHIHEKGYDGIVGMEHGNSTQGIDGELAVIDAYRRVDPRED